LLFPGQKPEKCLNSRTCQKFQDNLFSLGFQDGWEAWVEVQCFANTVDVVYCTTAYHRLTDFGHTLTARRFDFDAARVNRACTTLDSLSCAHASDGGFHLAGSRTGR
jgi:hypothetical protein